MAKFLQEFRDFLGGVISWPADMIGNGVWGIAPAASGVLVTEFTAIQVAAYFSCIRIISDQIASLPLHVYERQADGSEIVAWNHPLERVVHLAPNDETPAPDFRQSGQGHLLMAGNCYIEIVDTNGGQPGGLFLRSPFRTMPYRRKDGSLLYQTTDTMDGHERTIDTDHMIHIRGFGLDGLVGLSPVKTYAKEVLGVDLAAQNYGGKFFANDTRPGGYLKTAAAMTDKQKMDAALTWQSAHSQSKSNSMAILDRGMQWEKVGVPPEEAQFIQTRQLNRAQIAAIFGVPGHLVGDDADAPRAVLEQKGVEFLLYTIKPWAKKWEASMSMKLFGVGSKYSVKFDTTSLERPTYDVLLKGIQAGRYSGLMTMNDGRRLLGLNPLVKENFKTDNPADKVMQPVNMVTVEIDQPEPAEPNPDSQGGVGGADTQPGAKNPKTPQVNSKVIAPMFADALGRLQSRKGVGAEKTMMPALAAIAMSFRSEDIIPEELAAFIRSYISGLTHRMGEDKLGTPEEELARAVREIQAKSDSIPEEDEGDPDAEDGDEEQNGKGKKRQ